MPAPSAEGGGWRLSRRQPAEPEWRRSRRKGRAVRRTGSGAGQAAECRAVRDSRERRERRGLTRRTPGGRGRAASPQRRFVTARGVPPIWGFIVNGGSPRRGESRGGDHGGGAAAAHYIRICTIPKGRASGAVVLRPVGRLLCSARSICRGSAAPDVRFLPAAGVPRPSCSSQDEGVSSDRARSRSRSDGPNRTAAIVSRRLAFAPVVGRGAARATRSRRFAAGANRRAVVSAYVAESAAVAQSAARVAVCPVRGACRSLRAEQLARPGAEPRAGPTGARGSPRAARHSTRPPAGPPAGGRRLVATRGGPATGPRPAARPAASPAHRHRWTCSHHGGLSLSFWAGFRMFPTGLAAHVRTRRACATRGQPGRECREAAEHRRPQEGAGHRTSSRTAKRA